MDSQTHISERITENQPEDKDAAGLQCRTAVPHARIASEKASAADFLLDVVARESCSPRQEPDVASQQAGAHDNKCSLPRDGVHPAAFPDLDELLRASGSPMARSPNTPRSPFSPRASSAPSSPDPAATAHLRSLLRLAPSSGSLERMLANRLPLHNSLSCSSFPFAGTSQLPSLSPEPFPMLPDAPLPAFRQHRVHSPLSAMLQGAREAPVQWMPAAQMQNWPDAGATQQTHRGTPPLAAHDCVSALPACCRHMRSSQLCLQTLMVGQSRTVAPQQGPATGLHARHRPARPTLTPPQLSHRLFRLKSGFRVAPGAPHDRTPP